MILSASNFPQNVAFVQAKAFQHLGLRNLMLAIMYDSKKCFDIINDIKTSTSLYQQ